MTRGPHYRPLPRKRPRGWRTNIARWLVGWNRPTPTRPDYPRPFDSRPGRNK